VTFGDGSGRHGIPRFILNRHLATWVSANSALRQAPHGNWNRPSRSDAIAPDGRSKALRKARS
jgi:hypothetical protein